MSSTSSPRIDSPGSFGARFEREHDARAEPEAEAVGRRSSRVGRRAPAAPLSSISTSGAVTAGTAVPDVERDAAQRHESICNRTAARFPRRNRARRPSPADSPGTVPHYIGRLEWTHGPERLRLGGPGIASVPLPGDASIARRCELKRSSAPHRGSPRPLRKPVPAGTEPLGHAYLDADDRRRDASRRVGDGAAGSALLRRGSGRIRWRNGYRAGRVQRRRRPGPRGLLDDHARRSHQRGQTRGHRGQESAAWRCSTAGGLAIQRSRIVIGAGLVVLPTNPESHNRLLPDSSSPACSRLSAWSVAQAPADGYAQVCMFRLLWCRIMACSAGKIFEASTELHRR